MAPLPENSPLYAEHPSVETALVSWRDDASPAVFETKNSGVALDKVSSSSPDHPDAFRLRQVSSARCSCRNLPSKAVSFLKQSWTNPRYFRWVMTIIISVFFAIFTGFFNSFGPLYLCLRRDLHSTAVETGSVASLGWSIGIMSPFVNVLYQRFGPRKIAIMGALLCCVGILSSSFVTSIWPMYVTFGLVYGIGVNFLMTGSMSLIGSHFSSNECALPTALPGIGSAVGMLVYSPLVELAYERFGWRNSLRFIAVLILVSGLISAIWNKRPASQKRKKANVCNSSSSDSVTSGDETNCPSTVAKEKEAEAKGKDEDIIIDEDIIKDETEVAFIKTKEQKTSSLQLKQEKLQLVRERRLMTKRNYIHLAKDPIHWMFCLATMMSNTVMLFNIINLLSKTASLVVRGGPRNIESLRSDDVRAKRHSLTLPPDTAGSGLACKLIQLCGYITPGSLPVVMQTASLRDVTQRKHLKHVRRIQSGGLLGE